MPRPRPSIDENHWSVCVATKASAYTLPDDLRDRLINDLGFPAEGIRALVKQIAFEIASLPFEGAPSWERKLAFFVSVKRLTRAFMRTGESRDELQEAIDALQLSDFGGVFRQSDGYVLDELAAYLEDPEAVPTDLDRLLRRFLAQLEKAIDLAAAGPSGQGRRPRLALRAAMSRLRDVFQGHCSSLDQRRPRRGVLSPYEERELKFVASALSQCLEIPGAFYLADSDRDDDERRRAKRKALRRELRNPECEPGRVKVGRSYWRPGDSSHWPPGTDRETP